MRDLPLNGLRVLASVLESGGIRAAARALSLSPSVVHRHLRELEARVGTPLVERSGNRLRFTAAGQRLGRVSAEALGELAVAVDSTIEDRRPNELVVATTESFAANWLLPRLARFPAAKRRYVISLKTDQRLSRIPRDADFAIRLGAYVDESLPAVDPLMDEIMVPVACAEMAERLQEAAAAEVVRLPLLHDRDPQVSWRRWCSAMGVDPNDARSGSRLSSSALVLRAAELGLGIALARRRLAEEALADRRLVELRHLAVPIGTAYWLVRRPVPRAAEQVVIAWLRQEAASNAHGSNTTANA
jgi:LysR family glycine cleavage system transcriptional activator